MNERINTILYKQTKIIYLNFNGLNNTTPENEKEFISNIEIAIQFIVTNGKDSLVLSDLRDISLNETISKKIKELKAKIKKDCKKSAVVCTKKKIHFLYRLLNFCNLCPCLAFKTPEAAKEWLIK